MIVNHRKNDQTNGCLLSVPLTSTDLSKAEDEIFQAIENDIETVRETGVPSLRIHVELYYYFYVKSSFFSKNVISFIFYILGLLPLQFYCLFPYGYS